MIDMDALNQMAKNIKRNFPVCGAIRGATVRIRR